MRINPPSSRQMRLRRTSANCNRMNGMIYSFMTFKRKQSQEILTEELALKLTEPLSKVGGQRRLEKRAGDFISGRGGVFDVGGSAEGIGGFGGDGGGRDGVVGEDEEGEVEPQNLVNRYHAVAVRIIIISRRETSGW